MIKKILIVNRAEMACRAIEDIPHMSELSSTINVRASHSISAHSRLRGNDWG